MEMAGIWRKTGLARHKAEKLSPNQWNPKKCKGLSSVPKIPGGRKLIFGTFYFPPAILVSLAGLSAYHSSFPKSLLCSLSSQLSTSLLALSKGLSQNTQHCLSSCSQLPSAPAHTPLLPFGRGILISQSHSPGSPWAPKFSRKVHNPTLSSILKTALCWLLPASIYTGSRFSYTHSRSLGRFDSKLTVSTSSPFSSIPNDRSSVIPSPPLPSPPY